MKVVTCLKANSALMPEAVEGEKYEVLYEYWHNWEGWYVLKAEDGTTFDAPDVFFE